MNPTTHADPERGFTLVEVMIATIVMIVGLLSVAYGLGLGLVTVQTSTEDTIAREKAREAMEDVFTARDTASITFDQICNVGSGTGCIFVAGATLLTPHDGLVGGFTPMTTPGADGIVNTADDGAVETLDTPGPDGILGTADDVLVPLTNFQRSIEITTITPILKQITVIILYTTPQGVSRSVKMVALLSPYV